jgi:hypothetical protein
MAAMIEIPQSVIAQIRLCARHGVSTGRDYLPHEAAYYRRCSWLHRRTGTLIMCTRDTGHHTSGWMKNPDFERCLHLSLSFREPRPQALTDDLIRPHVIADLGGWIGLAPWNTALAGQWVQAVLGETAKLSWHEGPFSTEGKKIGVQHWRVFCDRNWEPIHPRGEVYTKDFTEKGWRSWSEQHVEPNWVNAE